MLALTGKVRRFATSGRLLSVTAIWTFMGVGAAVGQVMVMAPDGAAIVYSGPTQFTDRGATPLAAQASRPERLAAEPEGGNTDALNRAAEIADLSPALVAAVAWRESGFRADRTSKSGAVGEMQLMPKTAKALRVDAAKDDENLRGGAVYLKSLLTRYHGDLTLALAAYNAGPGAVDRYGGPPPFKETQAYVAAILSRLSDVAQAGGGVDGLKDVVVAGGGVE
jgi:soluble lytic murein transglycosylase-like protein